MVCKYVFPMYHLSFPSLSRVFHKANVFSFDEIYFILILVSSLRILPGPRSWRLFLFFFFFLNIWLFCILACGVFWVNIFIMCEVAFEVFIFWCPIITPPFFETIILHPSSHLILCHPLLLLPLIPPSIRVFSNESTLSIEVTKVLEFQL